LNSEARSSDWRTALLPALTIFLFPFAANAAQSIQVVIDPAHTTISWTLSATMHTVHGTFRLKSGQISFDPVTGTANGEFVIDAASGQSGNRSRDDKMNKDVLETKKYPEITFLPKKVSGKVPGQGSTNLQIQGTFHIHGADHDLTLFIPLNISGAEAKAATSFDIPYEAWGMKNPGNFLLHVDNKVQISIESAGRITLAGTAHSGH
jgi:polyisoprenoid-binding protein YceI